MNRSGIQGRASVRSKIALVLLAARSVAGAARDESPRFRAVVFYSEAVEGDHVQFARDALKFLSGIAEKDQFQVDATTDWANLNETYLKPYQLVIWLNESPNKPEQRLAFQNYMEHGGAWLGFHGAGYNDKDTHWPWYVEFLGGAVFNINSWPPLPAKLLIDQRTHPVTADLPESYVAPLNEWYVWKPSPRLNKDVRVLLTLDPGNYPLGIKDVILVGDCPVVWSNTKYKMLYMNMGHGGKILSNATQNRLIENAVVWLGSGAAATAERKAIGVRVNPQAVVVNPKNTKVFAVHTDEGTVTVIDQASGAVKRIKVGTQPSAIDVNPLTNRIYVANAGDGSVSVIDGDTDKVVTTVNVGALPYVLAVNSGSNKVFVSKTFSDTTSVIEGATNQGRILNTGIQATAMVSDSLLNKTYLINLGNEVAVLDGATESISKLAGGNRVWGLATNPVTHKIYVGSTDGSTLTVIDGKSEAVSSVTVGDMPCAIAVDPVTNRIYVANYESGSVTVVDGSNNVVLVTLPAGTHPQAIAADPTTHTVYVANTGSHSVTVINGTTNAVMGTVDVGSGPYAVAATSEAGYVKCLGRDDLITIDSRTLKVTSVSRAVHE